jgi:glutaredoxin-like protein NrdH
MNANVKMYTLSTCSHCKAAKSLMDKCSVEYEFLDVDLLTGDEKKAALEEVRKLNKECTFPTIIINGKVIVGYREKDIKEALGL